MVEAKLRAEYTEQRHTDKPNPFYGHTNVKKVVEDIFTRKFDKRSNIASVGIHAVVKVGSGSLEITINRYYLEHEYTNGGTSTYVAFFNIEEKTYEVCVWIDGKHIISATLSEWLSGGEFENGDDADNVYHSESEKDFIDCDIYE